MKDDGEEYTKEQLDAAIDSLYSPRRFAVSKKQRRERTQEERDRDSLIQVSVMLPESYVKQANDIERSIRGSHKLSFFIARAMKHEIERIMNDK
jgi:hypothetical protein